MKEAKPGDQISACGKLVTIAKILYQEYWETRDLWDIEFIDTKGNYRHWKQSYDGGHFLPKREVWVVTKFTFNSMLIGNESHIEDCSEVIGVYGSEEKARKVQEELLLGNEEYPIDVCISGAFEIM